MGEQANEERIAELNRRKEEYEARERTQEREPEKEKFEDERRRSLAEQEGRERREEVARKQQEREEVESSASRIAAGRKAYREQKQEIEDSAPRIAAGRKEYRDKKAIEDSAERIEKGRRLHREEQELRKGRTESYKGDPNSTDFTFDNLTAREKGIVRDEVENSAGRLKKSKEAFVAQKKDEYYKNTSTGTQILDIMMGKSTAYRGKEPKPKPEPVTTFLGGQKRKMAERFDGMGSNFLKEFTRPVQSIQQGRQKRRELNENRGLVDPFAHLAAPQPRRDSRTRGTQVPMGTGLLFSEGFFNPPKGKTGRKTKSGGRRSRTGTLGDMLL
jgi:hypothetical protein